MGRGDGSRSALRFLERNPGRPQRRAHVFSAMCTVRGGHGAARCPREPRPYARGFDGVVSTTLNFLVSSRPEGVSRPGTAGRTVETDITRIRPIQARPPRSRGAVACDAAASADSCSARPLRVSSRRRRLGRLLRPLLRAQGGLQRRRRGRGAVAERACEVSCIVICRMVMWQ